MKTHRLHFAVLLTLLEVAFWLAANTVLSQSNDRTQNPKFVAGTNFSSASSCAHKGKAHLPADQL